MEWSEWVERNVDLANRNARVEGNLTGDRRVGRCDLLGEIVTVASLECRSKEISSVQIIECGERTRLLRP